MTKKETDVQEELSEIIDRTLSYIRAVNPCEYGTGIMGISLASDLLRIDIRALINSEALKLLDRIEKATPDFNKMDSYNRTFLEAMYKNTILKAIEKERQKYE